LNVCRGLRLQKGTPWGRREEDGKAGKGRLAESLLSVRGGKIGQILVSRERNICWLAALLLASFSRPC